MASITKLDYYLSVLIGFLTGVFLIPTAINLGITSYAVLFLLPIAIPVLFAIGIWLGIFLSRWVVIMVQFSKFVAVGLSNTAIDFGILNMLSMLTGITAGLQVGGVNVPGFVAAVVNSYFWNQNWVFKGRESGEGILHDFPKFLAVSVIGLIINSGIIILTTNYGEAVIGLQPEMRLNIAKVIATGVVLMWNFVGYKFLVFRKNNNSAAA